MRLHGTLKLLAGVALLGGAAGGAYLGRETWQPWLSSAGSTGAAEDDHDHRVRSDAARQVKLSPQAQANLRLVVKPLEAEAYWRTIQLPGFIVDRPAQSDRDVVAPVPGVVTKVYHFPGDTVRPGEPLFTLRLLSERLHLAQSELFKASKEVEIATDQRARLVAAGPGIPEAKIFEVDNQLRRLSVTAQAYRTELLTRGLTPAQIKGVAEGKFVAEVVVNAPSQHRPSKAAQSADGTPPFEVQELKVDLGQQVQAGQTMCLLSNHQSLYIEGRAFRQEAALLERSAKQGWPVQVEFMEEGDAWPALAQAFTIRHIGNTIDPASRTFAFYIPLANPFRRFEKDGRTMLIWRFRPGQMVRLNVRVEKLENVFVLPADAVVRAGPEAYVFRQSGDIFVRKPVRVVDQDRTHVVVANDGSVPPGLFVAQNGAAQINRVLQSDGGGLPPGTHMHADGSIHSNAAHK